MQLGHTQEYGAKACHNVTKIMRVNCGWNFKYIQKLASMKLSCLLDFGCN